MYFQVVPLKQEIRYNDNHFGLRYVQPALFYLDNNAHFDWTSQAKNPQTSTSIFGEALSFYQIDLDQPCIFVIYKPLVKVRLTLNCLEGEWEQGIMLALHASDIISLVGIWAGKDSVWILRKHPGLAMLTPEGCAVEVSEGGEGEAGIEESV